MIKIFHVCWTHLGQLGVESLLLLAVHRYKVVTERADMTSQLLGRQVLKDSKTCHCQTAVLHDLLPSQAEDNTDRERSRNRAGQTINTVLTAHPTENLLRLCLRAITSRETIMGYMYLKVHSMQRERHV